MEVGTWAQRKVVPCAMIRKLVSGMGSSVELDHRQTLEWVLPELCGLQNPGWPRLERPGSPGTQLEA